MPTSATSLLKEPDSSVPVVDAINLFFTSPESGTECTDVSFNRLHQAHEEFRSGWRLASIDLDGARGGGEDLLLRCFGQEEEEE